MMDGRDHRSGCNCPTCRGFDMYDAADLRAFADHRELADARTALGKGWLVGGVSLAEGIKRTTAILEKLGEHGFDLVEHLRRQRIFSRETFGPGARASGVVDHIRKELVEIEKEPGDLEEWIDVALLAFDGAWRAGHEPEAIAKALAAKQAKNEARKWPDWRTAAPGKAIEHVEETPAEAPYVCPGCHAVGEERCEPGCIDAEIEAANEECATCRRVDCECPQSSDDLDAEGEMP